jgi:RNA polymerase sigma-B factor
VRAVHELGQRNGTTPRPGDIGRYLGLDLDGVAEAMEAYHRSYCVSLDEPSTTEAGSEVLRFVNVLCTADHDLEMVVERESLGPLIEALPEREQRIVLLRFFGNRTQSQIAAEMSLSQMHVSRLLTATLAALRADLDRVPGGDR